MLTKDELEALYEECGEMYTDEELQFHFKDRSLKNELEIEHAFNYQAIRYALEWIDYLNRKREEPPAVKIWHTIRPGYNISNSRCQRFKAICEYFAAYKYHECPMLPIFVFCSRSGMTLLKLLGEIHETSTLIDLHDHLLEVIGLTSNRDERRMSDEQYRKLLMKRCDEVIEGFRVYSRELGSHLSGLIKDRSTNTPPPATKGDVEAAVQQGVDKTKKHITNAKNEIKSTVKKATQGYDEGCHHPNKEKDKLVQQVIEYLARPGVVFSIYNACVKVAGKGKGRSCKLIWLYDWCHAHSTQIRTHVDILRSTFQ